jgi:hypothetical protein
MTHADLGRTEGPPGPATPADAPASLSRGDSGGFWDPLGAWPGGRRWIWALLAGLICLAQGREFVSFCFAPQPGWTDLIQDWASARNVREGLPVYTSHDLTVARYLGQGQRQPMIERNAHPPTSVLLVLPLGWLNYRAAFLVWGVISLLALGGSLWLVGRALEIRPPAWAIFPAVALLVMCGPLQAQMFHGQLNLVLLLMLTGAWTAERSGRPGLAGVLLGAAAAIKLFPALLLLHFAFCRRWRVVLPGFAALAALSALTALVLGPATYETFLREVLPQGPKFRAAWNNASIPALWYKLFDPESGGIYTWRITPLWPSPALARVAGIASCAAVLAAVAWADRRARTQTQSDFAFGAAVVAMLLVSPITWDHYLLLVLVPLALLWANLPSAGWAKALFLLIFVALWLNPRATCDSVLKGGGLGQQQLSPIHTLTLLSFQCYALLALFALQVRGVATSGAGPSAVVADASQQGGASS